MWLLYTKTIEMSTFISVSSNSFICFPANIFNFIKNYFFFTLSTFARQNKKITQKTAVFSELKRFFRCLCSLFSVFSVQYYYSFLLKKSQAVLLITFIDKDCKAAAFLHVRRRSYDAVIYIVPAENTGCSRNHIVTGKEKITFSFIQKGFLPSL